MVVLTKEQEEHLQWAIGIRARNQICSLNLLALFEEYEEQWKTKKFSRAAQDLSAAAFSLWRAAFLAGGKTSKRGAVFDHGRVFLKKVIEDNSISFLQDKNSLEWTFNYYTRNARSSLQVLAKYWPNVALPYAGQTRAPKDRWTYCQDLLDTAVRNFRPLLAAKKETEVRSKQASVVRSAARKRRQLSRSITLNKRKKP